MNIQQLTHSQQRTVLEYVAQAATRRNALRMPPRITMKGNAASRMGKVLVHSARAQ